MTQPKSDVLQGTLDLMVLKTLETLGRMHGYGIAQRLQQVSGRLFQLNQGTLYPALLRLEQKGWITAGHDGEQPPGQVLQPDAGRADAARARSGGLDAHR